MGAAKAFGLETRPSDKQDGSVFFWTAGVIARLLIRPQPDVPMKPPYFIQQQIKAEAQTSVLRRHLSNGLLLISVLYPRRSNLPRRRVLLELAVTPERRPRDGPSKCPSAYGATAGARQCVRGEHPESRWVCTALFDLGLSRHATGVSLRRRGGMDVHAVCQRLRRRLTAVTRGSEKSPTLVMDGRHYALPEPELSGIKQTN